MKGQYGEAVIVLESGSAFLGEFFPVGIGLVNVLRCIGRELLGAFCIPVEI